jgi:hypothetical protein
MSSLLDGSWPLLRIGVRELEADIQAWIQAWNDDPRPFVWTKTADQILESIASYLQLINDSEH